MKKHNKRLAFILFILGSLGLATGLALFALKDNISFFYSPSQLDEHPELARSGRVFRLGGLVEKGSIVRNGLSISFTVTDEIKTIHVTYKGIPPDLFRDGQGVVATGNLGTDGNFTATDLLAKHDENYMPPEVAKSLEAAAKKKRPE